tara:strand:- start:333 stop:869 length:537 start_codon:yes stop_codon:yes gene_type:complete
MVAKKTKKTTSVKKTNQADELKKNKAKYNALNKKYKALEQESKSIKDKQVRLLAEFDNFRKRTILEKERLITYDGEKIITSLLSSFDDLERTISQEYKEAESIQEGIRIIIANIRKILTKNEINQFSSIGDKFNPDLHEALMSESGKEDNIVLKEFESGYKYKDKVIRHAKVVVSSKS